jgi:hypothetical protein
MPNRETPRKMAAVDLVFIEIETFPARRPSFVNRPSLIQCH